MLLGGLPEVCALRDSGGGGREGAEELVWEEGVEEDPVWRRGLAWEAREGGGAGAGDGLLFVEEGLGRRCL